MALEYPLSWLIPLKIQIFLRLMESDERPAFISVSALVVELMDTPESPKTNHDSANIGPSRYLLILILIKHNIVFGQFMDKM